MCHSWVRTDSPREESALDGKTPEVYIHFMADDGTDSAARTLLETCLCHRARMAARTITRAYDDALRPSGLRATQLAVLAAVGARGALSIKSLADDMGMDRTTLTRNLRPLEQQGLVRLAPEARYRSRVLTLTPSGRTALHDAMPLWEAAQRAMRRRLGVER